MTGRRTCRNERSTSTSACWARWLSHDSRDNIFTPNKGLFFEMEAAFARGTFGSDANYRTVNARVYSWHPVGDWVLGMRGDARTSGGDVPFYAEPYVTLRGVPSVRYQDKNALVGEGRRAGTSLRAGRWSGLRAWARPTDAASRGARARRSLRGGVGFRYLVARKLNLYAGIDVARGPEDSVFYITAGSAWR
jgi:hypothetical protein